MIEEIDFLQIHFMQSLAIFQLKFGSQSIGLHSPNHNNEIFRTFHPQSDFYFPNWQKSVDGSLIKSSSKIEWVCFLC